ncbi:guanylate cyclase domain-containing protein, partial [Haematococcus lacustris]
YLWRCVLLRAVLVATSLFDIDTAIAAVARLARWGLTERIALLALVLPIIWNLAGAVWPLLSCSSYEQHHQRFNLT